jgi:hypothetical protein
MPTRSTIDRHPERESIYRDLALNTPLRRLSQKYGLGVTALFNARRKMPDTLKRAMLASALKPAERDLEKLKTEESAGLLANLSAQRVRLLLAQDACLASEQWGAMAQISAQVHANLRIVGTYLGELVSQHHTTHSTVSLVLSPQYLSLRHAILQALAPYPDVRRKVAAAIQRIEAEAAQQPPQAVLAPVVDVTPEVAAHG